MYPSGSNQYPEPTWLLRSMTADKIELGRKSKAIPPEAFAQIVEPIVIEIAAIISTALS